MLPQTTIANSVTVDGPGLFSGEPARLTFRPAEPDTGIRFQRSAGDVRADIPALIDNLLERPRHTCLRNGSLRVETVEHCLAALAGLGIRNTVISVESDAEGSGEGFSGELPMVDGSSRPFVDAVLEAGVQEQAGTVEPLIIRQPVQVAHGDATLAALPGPTDHLEILYQFEDEGPDGTGVVGRQTKFFKLYPPYAGKGTADDFVEQIAPARTFIFEHEAEELRRRGFGKHLTPRDLLVIGKDGPVENAYRFEDELVRHKILDLIGDLSLVGRPLCGRLVAYKSGHGLNHRLARQLLLQRQSDARSAMLDRTDAAMDVRAIQRILPHRFPMLLVDKVLEIDGDQKAVGVKNVTFNDIYFQGHYPGTPIFPGVLIVEAMAQLGGILLSRKLEHTGKLAVLLSMDRVKMRTPVVPGDQLILEARAVRVKSRTGHMRCKAYVQDKTAAEADIKFMLVDAEPVV
ncbi:MAG: UDP-3-O-acyl-N-acetylglucosamine deacetylase [Planctomycetota bacterium]